MMSSVSTLPPTYSSSGATPSWVCVYGVDPSIQDVVLDRFASYGRIVHQKSVGVNAVAFRYDSPLSAGKALCQNRFQVRGRYCGVFAMSDNDTSLLALETPVRMEPNAATATKTTPASLFAPSATGASTNPRRGGTGFATAAVDERDADADNIYQHRKPYRGGRDPANQQQHESLCLRIVRWLLSAE
jgi:Nup53/35/40-type RNA recognition motif